MDIRDFVPAIQRDPECRTKLTASLPVVDGKSEKFNFFEDFFKKQHQSVLHLTEIQEINYFHSVLDDTKKGNLEEVTTAFKQRLGDFRTSTKARCE